MRHLDLRDQRGVGRGPRRWLPLPPCIVAAGRDTQQLTHGGDRVVRLVIAHEPEPFAGISFVSRANQAAAPGSREISRSGRSWRFSRRRRQSSSRSAVVRPPLPRPALRSLSPTQFLSVPAPRACGRRPPTRPSGDGTQGRRNRSNFNQRLRERECSHQSDHVSVSNLLQNSYRLVQGRRRVARDDDLSIQTETFEAHMAPLGGWRRPGSVARRYRAETRASTGWFHAGAERKYWHLMPAPIAK